MVEPSILSERPAKYSNVHAPYRISERASRNVLPLFSDSILANSFAAPYVAAAILFKILPR